MVAAEASLELLPSALGLKLAVVGSPLRHVPFPPPVPPVVEVDAEDVSLIELLLSSEFRLCSAQKCGG